MNRKNLLRVSTILLIVVVGFAHSYDDDGYNVDDDDGYGSSKYGDDGYDDGGVYSYIGWSGKDPRKDGIDIGDYGPVFGKNDSMLAKMNFWITAVDDWEEKGSRRYGSGKYGSGKYGSGKYGSNKYGSNKYDSNKYGSNKYDSDKYDSDKYDSDNYDSDNYDSGEYGSGNYNSGKNYKGGQRRKRSYTKVTFPVKQVKNYKKFPFHRFPPLISIAPWLPIFYDKLTYQTFIFSPTGGLYIIPPLINFYGQRFAVAQLVKWGYASLVSSGVPPPPAVNVAPLVSPAVPVGGAPVGGAPVGGAPVAGAPAKKPVEYKNVNTNFPQFRPRPDYLQKNINNVPNNNAPGPYSG